MFGTGAYGGFPPLNQALSQQETNVSMIFSDASRKECKLKVASFSVADVIQAREFYKNNRSYADKPCCVIGGI